MTRFSYNSHIPHTPVYMYILYTCTCYYYIMYSCQASELTCAPYILNLQAKILYSDSNGNTKSLEKPRSSIIIQVPHTNFMYGHTLNTCNNKESIAVTTVGSYANTTFVTTDVGWRYVHTPMLNQLHPRQMHSQVFMTTCTHIHTCINNMQMHKHIQLQSQ